MKVKMLKLEEFGRTIQYAVYTHPFRLWNSHANFFGESINKNANLSLGTGMGFSYFVHLIIKPKTLQFWGKVMIGVINCKRSKPFFCVPE